MDKAKYLVIVVLVLAAGYLGFSYTKKNLINPGPTTSTSNPTVTPSPKAAPNYPLTIGQFSITDKEVCSENGKPLVYFFGSTSCPHCVWEKPIAQKVFTKFKDQISYKEDFDTQNYSEVFQRYSDINPGYIPFLVLGCKYIRVGAGENLGKDDTESKKLEEEALSTILCKLTNGNPGSVCNSLKDKVSQIP